MPTTRGGHDKKGNLWTEEERPVFATQRMSGEDLFLEQDRLERWLSDKHADGGVVLNIK